MRRVEHRRGLQVMSLQLVSVASKEAALKTSVANVSDGAWVHRISGIS